MTDLSEQQHLTPQAQSIVLTRHMDESLLEYRAIEVRFNLEQKCLVPVMRLRETLCEEPLLNRCEGHGAALGVRGV